jgi:hypothetical protein
MTQAKRTLIKAPTVSKNSVRVMLSLAASLPHDNKRLRDITQAYTQSKSEVQRRIVCEAPPELGLPEDCVLVVIRPLYGIPEAALHWFITYGDFYKNDLRMVPTGLDACLFHRKGERQQSTEQFGKCQILPDGLVALQVDDSFISGSPAFLREELQKVAQFQCKEAMDIVEGGETVTFNGAELKLQDGVFFMSMDAKCSAILEEVTIDNLISLRALAAYIALWCRPRVLGKTQLLASKARAPSDADVKQLHDIIHELKSPGGLSFRPLNLSELRVVCYSDAGFASHADDFRSQIG